MVGGAPGPIGAIAVDHFGLTVCGAMGLHVRDLLAIRVVCDVDVVCALSDDARFSHAVERASRLDGEHGKGLSHGGSGDATEGKKSGCGESFEIHSGVESRGGLALLDTFTMAIVGVWRIAPEREIEPPY